MDNDTKAITAAAIRKAGSGYKLARNLGVTDAAVSRWRRGIKKPNADHLLAMLRMAGKLAAAVAIFTTATLLHTTGDADAKTNAPATVSIYTLYAYVATGLPLT